MVGFLKIFQGENGGQVLVGAAITEYHGQEGLDNKHVSHSSRLGASIARVLVRTVFPIYS